MRVSRVVALPYRAYRSARTGCKAAHREPSTRQRLDSAAGAAMRMACPRCCCSRANPRRRSLFRDGVRKETERDMD